MNISSCILFIDVATAFATMLRRTIDSDISCDEEWLIFLKATGFCDQDIKAIYDSVCHFSTWDTDGLGNLLPPNDQSLSAELAKA